MGKTPSQYIYEDFFQDLESIEQDWKRYEGLCFWPKFDARRSRAFQDFIRHWRDEKWGEKGQAVLQCIGPW